MAEHNPGETEAGFGWASDAIAQTVQDLGYKYLALVPGSSFRGLQDSFVNYLGNSEPELVMCLHEVQSVMIAEGYARATNEPMAVALHANVGLMNGAMGIFDAWCDRQPMLVIGATGPVDAHKRRPWIDWVHTARDQGALVRNYVKWDDAPASAEAAVEAMLRADQITRTEPRGPVYVCLDAGMQETRLERDVRVPDVSRFAPPAAPSASEQTITQILQQLQDARHPVILFGRGGRSQAAWDNRVKLAEALGATVLTSMNNASNFPTEHPLHVLRPVGDAPSEAEKELIAKADLILSFDWHDLAGFLSARTGSSQTQVPHSATIISCSLDGYLANGWSMDHQALAAVDLQVLSAPDQLVSQLLAAAEGTVFADRCTQQGHWTAEAEARAQWLRSTDLRAVDVSLIVSREFAELPVTYARLSFGWTSLACRFRGPLDFLGKDAGGTVGSGPGHAVGAALALAGSERMVVGVMGDGDFAVGMQALWTASHMKLPMMMIIVNNRSYFNDERHQERVALERGRPVENKHIGQRIEPAVDNPAIARAQGFEYARQVTTAEELVEALKQATETVSQGGRALIDVSVIGGYGED